MIRSRVLLVLLATLAATPACTTSLAGPTPGVTISPEENGVIIESATGRRLTVDSVAALAALADVLLFGETHDDSTAHRVQLELAQRLAARGTDVIIGLEMFGRDVQGILDDHLRADARAADFLQRSRAWANYLTDYAPVVEVARVRGWPVIGTNLPQAQATLVARQGLEALESVPGPDRAFAASVHECPRDAYWDRFIGELTEESDSAAHAEISPDDPVMSRMFDAQCARDEAMAESIAAAATPGTLIYHLNGSFHSDYRLGIVPRLLRRRPDLRIVVISVLPAVDFAEGGLPKHRGRGDFLLITRYTE